MKPAIQKNALLAAFVSIIALFIHSAIYAQQKVEIEEQDVGNFFERNWMWITGVIVLLLLIIIFSRNNSGKRTTTTIIKDTTGNVETVKTSKIED
jgi:cell division protein FtsW (lipid II flippase)